MLYFSGMLMSCKIVNNFCFGGLGVVMLVKFIVVEVLIYEFKLIDKYNL